MKSAKSVAFVLNAEAANFEKHSKDLLLHRSLFQDWKMQFLTIGRSAPLEHSLRKIDLKGLDALVLFGGDGTLNCGLNAFMKLGVPLFLYPSGTANDFAMHLGHFSNFESMRATLERNLAKSVDIITVNKVPFATVGGIGIGSIMTKDINNLKSYSPLLRKGLKLLGTSVYTGMALKVILQKKSYVRRFRIQCKEMNEVLTSGCILICNQPFFARNMLVSPESKHDDGMFEVMSLQDRTSNRFLQSLTAMKTQKEPAGAIRWRTNSLVVESEDGNNIAVFGDGEPLLQASRLEFEVLPKALKVFISA